MIAILSIFSITYRVYGWNKFMNPWHRQGYGYEEDDWKQYIISGDIRTHLFSGSSDYSGDGILRAPGGKTDGKAPHDNGATAVGSNGSDGNTGYAGAWNGSANFDRNSKIVSGGENFKPSDVNDVIESIVSTSESVIWLKDLCNYVGVLCSALGMPLTGSNNYIPKIYTTGIYDATEIMREYEEKVDKCRDEEKKKVAKEYLKDLRYTLDTTVQGLPELLANSMTNPEGKYVVFCKNIEDMQKEKRKRRVSATFKNLTRAQLATFANTIERT